MRDPWLLWSGIALVPLGAICLYQAVHATKPKRELALEIAGRVIAGTAGIAIGYEIAFRTAVKSAPELKTNTAIGLFLLIGGLICIVNALLRAFNK